MEEKDFRELCVNTVFNYVFLHLDKEELKFFEIEDIHVIIISSILQNNKAVIQTSGSDNKIYILTYDGNESEVKIEVYNKLETFYMKGEKDYVR